MKRENFIDALGVRASLDGNDCQGNAQTCRDSIKSILTTKRTVGWSNFPNLRKRRLNRDIGISFDAPSLIGDNLYVKVNGRNKNPIYNTTEACSSDTDQGSDLEANTGDFAILAQHGGRLFQSSYSVYSLPEPGTISNNWNVTVKAINGPVYVYPSYNTTTETQPKINNKNYAILTTVIQQLNSSTQTETFLQPLRLGLSLILLPRTMLLTTARKGLPRSLEITCWKQPDFVYSPLELIAVGRT